MSEGTSFWNTDEMRELGRRGAPCLSFWGYRELWLSAAWLVGRRGGPPSRKLTQTSLVEAIGPMGSAVSVPYTQGEYSGHCTAVLLSGGVGDPCVSLALSKVLALGISWRPQDNSKPLGALAVLEPNTTLLCDLGLHITLSEPQGSLSIAAA